MERQTVAAGLALGAGLVGVCAAGAFLSVWWLRASRIPRLTVALRVQLALLGALLPPCLVVTWWHWLLSGASALLVSSVWTGVELRRAERHLLERVRRALEGLIARGDAKADPELWQRLEQLGVSWPGPPRA